VKSEKAKKGIIRMMIPVFCHFHTVLLVILFYGIEAEIMRMMLPDVCHFHTVLHAIYLMVLRQRREMKRAREKRDHKDDVS
jgi:hypothetical protein